jgi:hypothetical protein
MKISAESSKRKLRCIVLLEMRKFIASVIRFTKDTVESRQVDQFLEANDAGKREV